MGVDKPDWTYVSEISAGTVTIDTSGGPVDVDASDSLVYVTPASGATFNISGDVNANITNTSIDVNVTNSSITVTPDSTSTWNVNVTNSSITVTPDADSTWNVNVTNSSINVTGSVEVYPQSGSQWDVNVTNSSITVSGTVDVNSVSGTVNISGDVNANITNASIAVTNATDEYGNPIPLDINVTNSTINVSGSVDANITNSTITVEPASGVTFDVNITNSSITVSGSVDANITNSSIVVEPASGATFNVSGSVDVTGSEVNINTINTTVEVQAPTGDILRATELYDKTYVFTRSASLGGGDSDQFDLPITGKIAQIAVSFTFSDYTSPLDFRVTIYEPSTGATYQWTADDLFTLAGYKEALDSGFAYNYKDFSPTSGGYVDCVYVDANSLGQVKSAGFVIRIPIKLNGTSSNPGYIKVENLSTSVACTVDYGAVFLHY